MPQLWERLNRSFLQLCMVKTDYLNEKHRLCFIEVFRLLLKLVQINNYQAKS